MKIQRHILNEIIFSLPASPIETGGIIGGTNGIITHCVFDGGKNNGQRYGSYTPDTDFLNRIIHDWGKKEISFYGIFHSHFPISTELSNGDKHYISRIINALSDQLDALYFPIVIPHSHMTVYRAHIDSDGVQICSDKIEVINGGT